MASSSSSSNSPSSWVSAVRAEFPGLVSANHWVLCDAPGGTQVHSSIVAAVASRLSATTANLGGTYSSALNTIRGKLSTVEHHKRIYIASAVALRLVATTANLSGTYPSALNTIKDKLSTVVSHKRISIASAVALRLIATTANLGGTYPLALNAKG